MHFELSIQIQRRPADVFKFLRDKDKHSQEEGSPVLLIEKTTPGSVGVGTRYREVVQMLPSYRGEILSEITGYEPNEWIEEDFRGAGMRGHLTYELLPSGAGTELIQRETLHCRGVLRFCAPAIRLLLDRRLRERLEKIKAVLETGSTPT